MPVKETRSKTDESLWILRYDDFKPEEELLREALCTLANGYFGTRGVQPEAKESEIHYPGTYVAGLYNRLKSFIAGRTVENEDFVNCPNWVYTTFRIGDGPWFIPSSDEFQLLDFSQELDMRRGLLRRVLRFKDSEGRITRVETERIVSMAHPHLAALRYAVIPENYNGRITFRTELDGDVRNWLVKRYRQLKHKHWVPLFAGRVGTSGLILSMRTNQSKVKIVEAANVKIFKDGKESNFTPHLIIDGSKRIGYDITLNVREGHKYELQKIVAIYTSKDPYERSPEEDAISLIKSVKSFEEALADHERAWEKIWHKADLVVDGDWFSQLALRFHIFHVLQTASPHTPKFDVGFPARGLHGEAYRGHIFWDTVYVMPFFVTYFPEIAKGLIMYRYRRLPAARRYAKEYGYRGAMFPWQSGSTGREETQQMHLNPLSGEWFPDYSRYQRHVSLAIAYNVWLYWTKTRDWEFMRDYGAELLLSIAQFAGSLVKYDPSDGRYHTEKVMGPDEFHEKYPDTDEPGLKDNAYTNIMIVWLLLRALELWDQLDEYTKNRLKAKIKLTNQELEKWKDITYKMRIPMNEDWIIEQFDGYFKLKEVDWDYYRKKYGNIQRMDRILRAEGKEPDEYKVTKQADVLMAFYLLSLDEIEYIFNRLGYKPPISMKEVLERNYDYYIKRTSHGSTLSRIVHAYIALLLDRKDEAWELYKDSLRSDLEDIQGGTTLEGIHAGLMGGTIVVALKGFAGFDTTEKGFQLRPNLPPHWNYMLFKLPLKTGLASAKVSNKRVEVDPGDIKEEVELEIRDKVFKLTPGEKLEIDL